MLELSSAGVHAGVHRRAEEQKSIVEIKPVTVVKHGNIWPFYSPTPAHLAVGNTYVRLLEIYSGVTVTKFIEIGWHSTKLLQKQKYAVFETR